MWWGCLNMPIKRVVHPRCVDNNRLMLGCGPKTIACGLVYYSGLRHNNIEYDY